MQNAKQACCFALKFSYCCGWYYSLYINYSANDGEIKGKYSK